MSTKVEEVYFLGKTKAAAKPAQANTKLSVSETHQYRRKIRFMSEIDISPFRAISTPFPRHAFTSQG